MGSMDATAQGILEQLPSVVRDVWGGSARPLPQWVHVVVNKDAVRRVLELAKATTVELGVEPDFIPQVEPAELVAYWAIVFRDLYDQEILRFPVDPARVQVAVAKRIASSVFSMHQQSVRFRNFLTFGPPPGVQKLPEYTGSERTRTFAVPWAWRRTAAQKDRSLQYSSCVNSHPRRVQSYRSQQCAPSDVLHPSLFT